MDLELALEAHCRWAQLEARRAGVSLPSFQALREYLDFAVEAMPALDLQDTKVVVLARRGWRWRAGIVCGDGLLLVTTPPFENFWTSRVGQHHGKFRAAFHHLRVEDGRVDLDLMAWSLCAQLADQVGVKGGVAA